MTLAGVVGGAGGYVGGQDVVAKRGEIGRVVAGAEAELEDRGGGGETRCEGETELGGLGCGVASPARVVPCFPDATLVLHEHIVTVGRGSARCSDLVAQKGRFRLLLGESIAILRPP